MDDASLLSLYESLSSRQKEFIVGHLNVLRDTQVLSAPSRQTVSKWKADSRDFLSVYEDLRARNWRFPALQGLVPGSTPQEMADSVSAIIETAVKTRADSAVPFDDRAVRLAEAELQKAPDVLPTLGQQLEVMSQHLPKVVRRHLAIILDSSTSNKDAISAIRLFYETLGVTPESLVPGGRTNKMIVNVLQMVGPQLAAVAKERGLDMSGEMRSLLHAYPELFSVDGEFHVEGEGESSTCANSRAEECKAEESDGQVPSMFDIPGEGCDSMETTHDSVPLSDNG